ncbi:GH39 family glycosyl hydrolase [Niallia nealsonii]|uniref:Glycosyl hydrolases family 39 N-terminal catalytic domain-containing protein n=1 Tax=Niallia nealsonii TaxID=115979 RepID=A0A2N0Z2I1_9BACI|nr:endo-1,4-beta-xylanase [Niallia nealsonii]PKG23715.1 hypothetical protein CWS01_10250 [Niallia nealsonii]
MSVKISYLKKIFLIFLMILLLSTGCQNKKQHQISSTYFGMHIQNPNNYSLHSNTMGNLGYGSVRFWDTGTKWLNLEPQKGKYDFKKLDQLVSAALDNNQEILLTLGQPPSWATGNKSISEYGDNYNSIPPANIEDWRKYVKTVGERYKGKITAYEIWNEVNIKGFYSGSIEELVTLTKEANYILKKIDPNIIIVSPGMANGMEGVHFLEAYLKAGGIQFVDAISVHLYVNPYPPEEMIPLIKNYRQVVDETSSKQMPIWNTEFTWVNFTMDKEINNSTIMPDELASSYLARALLIGIGMEIERNYFYGLDYSTSKIQLVDLLNQKSIKLPGVAYRNVSSWLIGASIRNFSHKEGYYLLNIKLKDGKKGIIAWAEKSEKKIKLPPGFSEGNYFSTIGEINTYSGGEIYLTNMPVLVYKD